MGVPFTGDERNSGDKELLLAGERRGDLKAALTFFDDKYEMVRLRATGVEGSPDIAYHILVQRHTNHAHEPKFVYEHNAFEAKE